MTQPTPFEAEILPLYEEHRADWLTRARKAAIELGKTGQPVTVNDVRKLCPPLEGADPRVFGAVFSDRNTWDRLSYVSSDRRACHGRPVAQFKLRGV